jgi:uncharacterized membrane protein required for colicin V production
MVGALLLIGIGFGIKDGAIKIIVSLGLTAATLVLVYFLTPYIAKGIEKFTPLDDIMEEQAIQTMAKVIDPTGEGAAAIEEVPVVGADSADTEVTQEQILALVGQNMTRDEQINAIERSDFPEIIKSLLKENNNSVTYAELGVTSFGNYVAHYLSKLILHMAAFICSFIIAWIVLRAIVFSLDIISDLPGVGFVNRAFGAIIGMGTALVIVWTMFVIITLLYSTSFGRNAYTMIESQPFLKLIYDNNPIMKLSVILK